MYAKARRKCISANAQRSGHPAWFESLTMTPFFCYSSFSPPVGGLPLSMTWCVFAISRNNSGKGGTQVDAPKSGQGHDRKAGRAYGLQRGSFFLS